MENAEEKCPHCGKKNSFIVRQSGYADVMPMEFSLKSQTLYHVVCLECGTVIRSFIKEPKKLLTDKEKIEKMYKSL